MRPLFYSDIHGTGKYAPDSSNFKVGYESYFNDFHPYQRESGLSIFDIAIIIERNTKQVLRENKKYTPGLYNTYIIIYII